MVVVVYCAAAASVVKFDGNEGGDWNAICGFLEQCVLSDEPRCQDRTTGGMLGRLAGAGICGMGVDGMNEVMNH